MHDFRARPPHRPLDLGRVEPATDHRRPCPKPAARALERGARALEALDPVAARTEQRLDLRDGSLLAARLAIAVVKKQYVHWRRFNDVHWKLAAYAHSPRHQLPPALPPAALRAARRAVRRRGLLL